jgi:hypothetical protein
MHIHTDGVSAFWGAMSTLIIFHAMRGLGGAIGSRGAPGLGKIIGGLATFN